MVMVGNMLAGTEETPGSLVEHNSSFYKNYDGSSTYKQNRVEGVKGLVPYKGHAQNVFNRLFEGLQSCCSYQGASNLLELKKAEFIEITTAGLKESLPHDIILK